PKWVEYRVGSNILALAERGGRFSDPAPPVGVLSLQLAFRVAPGELAGCADVLKERGVANVDGPTDQPFGPRTLFFRAPDGKVLEMEGEIGGPRPGRGRKSPARVTPERAVIIEVDTPRLRLRQWREADREPFAALNADPVVMEFFTSVQSRESSDASIDAW